MAGYTEITSTIKEKIENFDLIGVDIVGNIASIVYLFIRDGKVVSTIQKIIKNSHGYELEEIYKRALIQFYNEKEKLICKEIFIADEFSETKEIESFFKIKFNKKLVSYLWFNPRILWEKSGQDSDIRKVTTVIIFVLSDDIDFPLMAY